MTEQNKGTEQVNSDPHIDQTKDSTPVKKPTYLGLVIISIVTLLGFSSGYLVLQQMRSNLDQAQQTITQLDQTIKDLQNDGRMQQFSSQIDSKLVRNQQQLDALSEHLQALTQDQSKTASLANLAYQKVIASKNDWMLHEAAHLLRIAQHRLLLARDFDTALAALHAADQRLQEIDAHDLTPIRESIGEYVQMLKEFPHPDYVALQLTLDSLNKELKLGLVDRPKQSQSAESPSIPDTDSGADKEDELVVATKKFLLDMLDYAKSAINDSVQVTRGDQQEPMITSEQKQTHDLISLKLQAAQQAIMHRDDLVYQRELDIALDMLKHSDIKNKTTIITTIKQLKLTQLQPELPDISLPEKLLAEYIVSHGEVE